MALQNSGYKTYKKIVDFLIVDDLENMRRSVRDMLLRSYGNDIEVDMAKSGRDALTTIRTKEVKFVISDWNMPHMTGIELLQIVRKEPDYYETPFLMISDEMSKEKFAYAIEECVDGYQIKPFTEKDLMQAINDIRTKRDNLSPIETKINMLRRLVLIKQYDKAIKICEDLLKEDPHPEVRYILGECFYYTKDYKNAGHHLKKLLDAETTSKAAYLYGKVCMANGQYEEAIQYLEQASDQNTLNLERRIEVGNVYLELGWEKEADDLFDSVMRSDPTDLNKVKMGQIFVKKHELKKAGKLLKDVQEPIPEALAVFNRYAIELRKQGDFEESLEQYKKCLEVVPDEPTILFNMGTVYFEMGDEERAKKKLRQTLALKPDFDRAQKLLDYLVKGKK